MCADIQPLMSIFGVAKNLARRFHTSQNLNLNDLALLIYYDSYKQNNMKSIPFNIYEPFQVSQFCYSSRTVDIAGSQQVIRFSCFEAFYFMFCSIDWEMGTGSLQFIIIN